MMKATLLSAMFALFCFSHLSAQDDFPEGSEGNNEFKINMLYFVLEGVELDYERILNPDFSIGLAANYWFSKSSEFKFMALPYFRFYPMQKLRASGFFLEGHMGAIGYDKWTYSFENGMYGGRIESRVSFGAGVAAGGKFISKSGFFGEAVAGLGRIFQEENYPDVYPRVGITIGKRF